MLVYATPIRKIIDEASIPTDFLTASDGPLAPLLDRLFFTDYAPIIDRDGVGVIIELVVAGEATFSLPGLEGVSFVVGDTGTGATLLSASFFVDTKGLRANLNDLTMAVRFPPAILKPVPESPGASVSAHAQIEVEGGLSIDENFDIHIEGFDALRLKPAMIGDSGVVISAENVKLDLSRTTALTEVITAGFDESFLGVFIGEAKVKLPEGLPELAPETLILRNAAIGSGGVSGRLKAHYSFEFDSSSKTFTGGGAGELFGIPFGVSHVVLDLKQNSFKEFKIDGQLLLPFFDKRVNVEVGLDLDGRFMVNVTGVVNEEDAFNPDTGLLKLKKANLLKLELDRLGFEVDDGVLTTRSSGRVTPLFGDLDWPSFGVKELVIDSEGNVLLEGGFINLREQYSLDIHGFRMEITKLGFGQTEDGGKWIGFSGGLKLADSMPVSASVEGFRLNWFDGEDGNVVGTKMTFKGIALAIDTEVVVGGGFLFYDPDKEQYAGGLQIEIKGISLNAIGLLTTRLPDGRQGFSLLIIIQSKDFPPIKLPLGFTLNGVGGLLGANRTVMVDVLRTGLKNRTLDAVLFPEDPLRNALQIVSNLRQVFPPKRDQFVFGPMAIIGWGTPTVLTIELGVVLEFPSPLRLIVLGQFRAFLPSEEKPLVRLQMDALGVVDFDKGEGSVDATLYDSRLMHYALSGDMALRARWNENPTFVLAVGGLNPNFQPPPGFPKLARMAVSLTKGNNPRLRLEAYLALTSNTVQFGAHLDLFVKMAGFSIEAYLGFDALFQFSPFQFVADFGGGVTLKWHGRTLMGVQLDMTLSGPSQWHARGKATFKIWRFSKSVSFDKKFGPEERPVTLPPADPLPELLEALRDTRNWSAQLPGQGHMLVSFRKGSESDGVLVHPQGDLTVRQRVVPLNVEISKFGNTKPRKDMRFTISEVRLDGTVAGEVRTVKDHFAAAQYIEMSDSAKISRPSFERMDAGIQIGTAHVTYGGQKKEKPNHRATATLAYETAVIAVEEEKSRDESRYEIPEDLIEAMAALGAAGRSPMSRTGRAKFQNTGLAVAEVVAGYVIATKNDLTIRDDIPGLEKGKATTYTAAAEALERYLAEHPEERGRLQVVDRQDMEGVTP